MNEDPRDDWTLLSLTAIAVLAAICAALAWPAAPREPAPEDAGLLAATPEAQWIATETPGEEMLVRRRDRLKQLARSAAERRAEEAELDELVRRSEDSLARARSAASKLEASARALRPALERADAAIEAVRGVPAPER